MRPSMDVASFSATKGRIRCSRANRNGALRAAASLPSSPCSAATPRRRRTSSPPRACGSGSRIAATTRRTPAARIASVHGGVWPWWAQGSRVTMSVAPRAASPARASAFTSAWGPPYSSWKPSPTTAPSRRTTAPTKGFGATRPQPRRARSRARRMASASGPRSEAEADADTSVDMPRGGVEVAVAGTELLVPAGLIADLAHELHRHKVEPGVREQHLAIVGHAGGDCLDDGIKRGIVVEPQMAGAAVVIEPEAGRHVEQDEPHAGRDAEVGRLEVGVELEVVSPGEVAELHAWQGAPHHAHRDGRNREGAVQDPHPCAVADAQRHTADPGRVGIDRQLVEIRRQ